MEKLKLLRCQKTNRSWYGLRRKMSISEVSELSILSYTQNRNIESLGNMSLPSNSDSSYNSIFKNEKMWAEQKAERFQNDLKEKIKISEISQFLILPYSQDRKLGNLGNFVYLEFWHWL